MAFALRKFSFRHHKLFFPAGLLSLSLLTIFGFRLLFSDPNFHKMHVMEICFASPEMKKQIVSDFFPENAETILVQGNISERQENLNCIDLAAGNIQKNKISTIFHISLGNESTWNDFVGILNIFHKKNLQRYYIDKNEIWVWSENYTTKKQEALTKAIEAKQVKQFEIPIAEIPFVVCGGNNDLINSKNIQPDQLQFQSLFSIPHFKLFISTFLFLIIFNLFSIRRKMKNSKFHKISIS